MTARASERERETDADSGGSGGRHIFTNPSAVRKSAVEEAGSVVVQATDCGACLCVLRKGRRHSFIFYPFFVSTAPFVEINSFQEVLDEPLSARGSILRGGQLRPADLRGLAGLFLV